jgi:hypothetical protein
MRGSIVFGRVPRFPIGLTVSFTWLATQRNAPVPPLEAASGTYELDSRLPAKLPRLMARETERVRNPFAVPREANACRPRPSTGKSLYSENRA